MMHSDVVQLFDLSSKVALITGGARHLGYDSAAILAAAGCDVVITSRESASAGESAGRLRREYGVETLALEMDQRSFASVEGAVRDAAAWKGRLDILVNNAGGTPDRGANTLLERDPAAVAELIEVNLTGVVWCCREAARAMIPRGTGKIINIASVAGLIGRDRRLYQRSDLKGQPVDYAAAKAGVIGLTHDLAGYLSPMGIHVNAISPGGFARQLPGTFIQDYSDRTPLARMGRDGIDLKGAVLFLASPASDYVTGANLVVDGGFSIWR